MRSEETEKILREIAPILAQARRVVVLTGAGVSAESGVPTFRDALTGLWANYRPEELATPEAFAQNPKLVWDWYQWRRELVERAEPNAAHRALAELENRVPKFTLITQNVDGLHQRAGSRNVFELHGAIRRVKCSAEGRVVTEWTADGEIPPRCPHCGAKLRPDVVWFGETLPEGALNSAIEASVECDFFCSIGTSGVVEPAASLPSVAAQFGAMTLTNNLDVTTSAAPPAYAINGQAGTILPALLRAAWPNAAI